MGTTIKQTEYYESGATGLKYGNMSGRAGSRALKSIHATGATTVACTHHDGGSEEYIMNDLEGGPGVPRTGINKKMEVMVESEEVKDDVSQTTIDRQKNWA